MKKLHRLLFFTASLLFLSSCNPKISTNIAKSYPPLDYKQEVVVINVSQKEPENAETIGYLKIGDTGFSTNCSYNTVIEKAKLEARKAGGNAVKITEYKAPNAMGSSCHRIKATILKITDIENFKPSEENNSDIIPDIDYAILNVYRHSGYGAIINYDLYLGDSVICRVTNNFKTTIHIKKDGLNTLWARTESKSEVPINIEIGKTYYLRCGITMGFFVGHPKLEIIDSKTGKNEFESFKAKNK